MSTISPDLSAPLKPSFVAPKERGQESPATATIISTLKMIPHVEGGYFVETDRDALRVPNPFADRAPGDDTRSASTSIYYLVTPQSPQGSFHRNKGRTVHTLHKGRGRYVLIHADEVEKGGKARVETFIVGHDIAKGERLQWIVEGGKYKASYLLEDGEEGSGSDGLLISET